MMALDDIQEEDLADKLRDRLDELYAILTPEERIALNEL